MLHIQKPWTAHEGHLKQYLGEQWIILSSFWSFLIIHMAYVHMLN